MRKQLTISVAGVAAFLGLAAFNTRHADLGESTIAWQDEIPQASQKRTLVYFGADWCPPCKVMKRDVWPADEVEAAVDQHYDAVYVDADERQDLMIRFGVQYLPTVLVLDVGEVVAATGPTDAVGMVGFLEANAGSR